jgi:carbonic anhydrase
MTNTLLKGFQEFRKEAYEGECTLMEQLVEHGQNPDYFIISCIDSRANPGTIFNPAPGTFFAHKAMGAIVRPYEKGTALAAALQFALNYQKVSTIVVLGHTGCGAVKALVDGLDDEEIQKFTDVVQHCACESYQDTEKRVILQSVENLKAYPSVSKALREKRIEIKSWLFDMEQGVILEADNGAFKAAA